ncbi:MAG TPA: nucleotidyl transferase [Candidatus Omnitrophica bacterium]|nr:nucleotidyl transferase [Candidatus Omnitrophota bacterium]
MRAIILAAGEGRRLRPYTVDRPKCMVEYRGKPLLDYQLGTMRRCGLNDILLIKGYCADSIKREGVKEAFNPRFDSTNMVYTFFCAEKYFDDDVVMSYGDIIYGKDILEPLLNSNDDFAVTVSMNWRELWSQRMPDPLADAETMKMSPDGRILELGKKPKSYSEIEGQYMGLWKASKKMMKEMIKVYHALDKNAVYDGKNYENMYMTSFIQILIDRGFPVKAVKVTGEWLEIDAAEDLNVKSGF